MTKEELIAALENAGFKKGNVGTARAHFVYDLFLHSGSACRVRVDTLKGLGFLMSVDFYQPTQAGAVFNRVALPQRMLEEITQKDIDALVDWIDTNDEAVINLTKMDFSWETISTGYIKAYLDNRINGGGLICWTQLDDNPDHKACVKIGLRETVLILADGNDISEEQIDMQTITYCGEECFLVDPNAITKTLLG